MLRGPRKKVAIQASAMSVPGEITGLLADWSNGSQAALDRLLPVVYDELRRLASSYMRRERPDHLLQTTALRLGPIFSLWLRK